MVKCPELKIYFENKVSKLNLETIKESSVIEARELTSSFFKNHVKRQNHFPESSQWAFYDKFFTEIALPYSKYKEIFISLIGASKIECQNLPKELERLLKFYCRYYNLPFNSKNSINLKSKFKTGMAQIWDSFLIIHSLFFILFLPLFKRNGYTAIWTGDYLSSKKELLDPRLGDFEKKLYDEKIDFVPFIRSIGVTPQFTFRNFLARKGFGIYYSHINSFISFLNTKSITVPQGNDFFESIFLELYFREAKNLLQQVKFWEKVFKFHNVKCYVSWFLSSRTASLLWATKKNKIPSIGFMHGVSINSYMGHEFMSEFEGNPIGTDYFGTWSSWWQEYFLEHSKIYPKGGIEISGPLKPKTPFTSKELKSEKKPITNIFIISETHLPVDQLLPYLTVLTENKNFIITFKVRPFGQDQFWTKMKNHPLININNYQVCNAPSPDCFENADLILGTHSTAMLEATALNKPIMILNTPKWGDYFNFKSMFRGECPFWAEDPTELNQKISSLSIQNINWVEVHNKFFGTESGSTWVINKIKQSSRAIS